MRKVILVCAAFLSVAFCSAAEDLKPLKDRNEFNEKLKTQANAVSSLSCDFTQSKYMVGMPMAIQSSGKFYYKKSDKMAMCYEKPMKSNMVINGTKLMMEANGKKNVVDASSNKLIGEMKNVIASCFTGNIQDMSDKYKMDFFDSGSLYMVKVVPTDEKAKMYVDYVELYLDKKDMTVSRMKMVQPEKKNKKGNDYTEYVFSNKKLNTSVPDSVFKVD